MYACMHAFTYACMDVCMYMYVWVMYEYVGYVCMHNGLYLFRYVRMYMCLYVCMYVTGWKCNKDNKSTPYMSKFFEETPWKGKPVMSKRRLEDKSKVEINTKFKTKWLLHILYIRFNNMKTYHWPQERTKFSCMILVKKKKTAIFSYTPSYSWSL